MIRIILTLLLFLFCNNIINSENITKFELVQLPYATDALEPVISKQTIDFHHGKHLQAYVNNLNNLIQGTPFETADLETIVKESDGAIFNNAGQILNHNLYFTQFSPTGGGKPTGRLAEAIDAAWGSFENFQKEFETAGAGLFGSGWVWLAADNDGNLSIVRESNAGNPLTKGLKPLLTFDVWEHAYYLDFQNRRADHLKSLWIIVDWKIVESRQNSQSGNDVKEEADITLRDYGAEPTVLDIDAYTMSNSNFRTALWTGTKLQVTLMSISVGGEVGLEQHSDTDQFLRIEDGEAKVMMGDDKESLTFIQAAEKDYAIIVPAGKWHNIINTGNKPLKLYSIYSPVEHPHGTVHKTFEEAEEAEHHH